MALAQDSNTARVDTLVQLMFYSTSNKSATITLDGETISTRSITGLHLYSFSRPLIPGVPHSLRITKPANLAASFAIVAQGYTVYSGKLPGATGYRNPSDIDLWHDFVLADRSLEGVKGGAALGTEGEPSVGDIEWTASLGQTRNGCAAGYLAIRAKDLNGDIHKRSNLAACMSPAALAEAELIYTDEDLDGTLESLRQIKSHQYLLDVSDLPTQNGYTIRFHQGGSRVGSTGPYTPSGATLAAYQIESVSTTLLRITRTETGSSRLITTEFEKIIGSANGLIWNLRKNGGGIEELTTVEETSIAGGFQRIWTRSYSTPPGGNSAAGREFKTRKKFKVFAALDGFQPEPRVVEVTEDLGLTGAERTTTYAYYESTAATRRTLYGMLRAKVEPYGKWEFYEYYNFGFVDETPSSSAPLYSDSYYDLWRFAKVNLWYEIFHRLSLLSGTLNHVYRTGDDGFPFDPQLGVEQFTSNSSAAAYESETVIVAFDWDEVSPMPLLSWTDRSGSNNQATRNSLLIQKNALWRTTVPLSHVNGVSKDFIQIARDYYYPNYNGALDMNSPASTPALEMSGVLVPNKHDASFEARKAFMPWFEVSRDNAKISYGYLQVGNYPSVPNAWCEIEISGTPIKAKSNAARGIRPERGSLQYSRLLAFEQVTPFLESPGTAYPGGARTASYSGDSSGAGYLTSFFSPVTFPHTFTGGGSASFTVDNLNLIAGKSTKTCKIYDSNGFLKFCEKWAWLGATDGWKLLTLESHTKDAFGRTTAITEQRGTNGGTRTIYQAGYDGLLLSYHIDVAGLRRDFDYDGLGRMTGYTLSSSGGSGQIPGNGNTGIAYSLSLDVLGQVVETRIGGVTGFITSTAVLDSSGTPLSTTDSDGLITNYAYLPQSGTGLQIAVTRPGNITEIYQSNKEGKLTSVAGSGVIAKQWTHGHDFAAGTNVQTTAVHVGPVGIPGPTGSMKTNWLGRNVFSQSATSGIANAESSSSYNANTSRLDFILSTEVSQDGAASTLTKRSIFEYDEFGQAIATGLDVNADNALTSASTDLITRGNGKLILDGGEIYLESTAESYPADSNGTAKVTTLSRSKLTGLAANIAALTTATDMRGNSSTQTTTLNPASAASTSTTTLSDGTTATLLHELGYLKTSITREGGQFAYHYDALGRLSLISQTEDTRSHGTSIIREAGKNRIWKTVSELNGDGTGSGKTHEFQYDAAGRVNRMIQPDGSETLIEYDPRNQVVKKWGSATVPEWFENDPALGWPVKHHTWQALGGNHPDLASATTPPAGSLVTVLNRHPATGVVLQKTQAFGSTDARTTHFTYDALGNLRTLTTPSSTAAPGLAATAAITKTFSYHPKTGRILGLNYSDATADIGYTHYRNGALNTVTETPGGSSATTRTFHQDVSGNGATALRLLDEDLPSYYATIPGLATNDSLHTGSRIAYAATSSGMKGRLSGVSFGTAGSTFGTLSAIRSTTAYQYAGSLLTGMTAGNTAIGYGYEPSSPLLRTRTSASSLTATFSRYPRSAQVSGVSTSFASQVRAGYEYAQDANGRRDSVTKTGSLYAGYGSGLFEDYHYDTSGRLTGSVNHQGNSVAGRAVPGRSFDFQYDSAGNLRSLTRPDAPDGAAATTYTPNNLNEFRTRASSTWLEVAGMAPVKWNLALKEPTGALSGRFKRTEQYYHLWKEISGTPLRKRTLDLYTSHPNSGSIDPADPARKLDRVAQRSISLLARPNTEALTYDARGNLVADAIWTYSWDGADRLTAIQTNTTAINAGREPVKLTFKYDWLGRRYAKEKYTFASNTFAANPNNITFYVWDGWNLLRQANYTVTWGSTNPSAATFNEETTYHWGPDLSGTLHGVGGTGGLVASVRRSAGQATGSPRFPAFDGNGNIMAMLDSSGVTQAEFEYDPYGRLLRASGPEAEQHHLRFATKLFDAETGLYYHQFRYYSPDTARFLSRDPAGSSGNSNPYCYAENDPAGSIDAFGLATYSISFGGGGSFRPSGGSSSGGGISLTSTFSFQGGFGGLRPANPYRPSQATGTAPGFSSMKSAQFSGQTSYPANSAATSYIRQAAFDSPAALDPTNSYSDLMAYGRGQFDTARTIASDTMLVDSFKGEKSAMHFAIQRDGYNKLGPGFEALSTQAINTASSMNAGAMNFQVVSVTSDVILLASKPEFLLLKAAAPAVKMGGGALGAVDNVLAAKGGSTTLWRSVSEAELRDVASSGVLRPSGGAMGNKWFAESASDAAAWGKKFYAFDKESVFTLKIDVPDNIAEQMMRMERLDGIGPARSADGALLDLINKHGTIKAIDGSVLPR